MNEPASRYALLQGLTNQTSSEDRRELLRKVTSALSSRTPSEAEFTALDDVLSAVAKDYSTQVRTEFARLVAASVTRFCHASEQFAMDEIEVAEPVLKHSQALSEETLLKVVYNKSQAHMLAVTQRPTVSEKVSHALVEHGDDNVVVSLLENERAMIADQTYDVVAERAQTSNVLQGPFVRRQGVPVDLLNGLYHKVEAELRREIVQKFDSASPADLEKAFERSRTRVTNTYRDAPADFAKAKKRVASLQASGRLVPPILVTLLREGPEARTAFTLAFARIVDVDFDVVDRAVETIDLDTLALLCRGARMDRGLFVTLAVGLDQSERGLSSAEKFGALYESVSIEAAQRALRFWKVRAA